MRYLVVVYLLLSVGQSFSAVPEDYKSILVEPPFAFTERVFDLTAAFHLAKGAGKPLFIYLGAKDCPPCDQYANFLRENRTALKDTYKKVVFVELSTWLNGAKIKFKFGDALYTWKEFNEKIGLGKKPYVFPYFWLIDGDMKSLKSFPATVNPFLDLDTHKAIFDLEVKSK